MSLLREPDALTDLVIHEHERLFAALAEFASGAKPAVLGPARATVQAFDVAERELLIPALHRVAASLPSEYLLADLADDRAEQLTGLRDLALTRTGTSRKLAVLKLVNAIRRDLSIRIDVMLPALASKLPRPQYRALALAFIERYRAAARDLAPPTAARRKRRVA